MPMWASQMSAICTAVSQHKRQDGRVDRVVSDCTDDGPAEVADEREIRGEEEDDEQDPTEALVEVQSERGHENPEPFEPK